MHAISSRRTFLASPMVQMVATAAFCGYSFSHLPKKYALPCALILLSGLSQCNLRHHRLRLYHECSLAGLHLLNWLQCQSIHWWDTITPDITLGALPLTFQHYEKIRQEHGAILSLVEPLEMHGIGIFSDPIIAQMGELNHKVISIADRCAPTIAQIKEAISYMHEHISCGKKIYVHCKAGKGRSAVVVICYLMQHAAMPFFQAYAFVKEKRPLISLNTAQWDAASSFAKETQLIEEN